MCSKVREEAAGESEARAGDVLAELNLMLVVYYHLFAHTYNVPPVNVEPDTLHEDELMILPATLPSIGGGGDVLTMMRSLPQGTHCK